MRFLAILLAVLLLASVTTPVRAVDYSKPTQENLVHGYGAVFFVFGYSIDNWVTYYGEKKLREQNEGKIKECAHSVRIELASDPSEATSKSDAMKAELEYMKAGNKRVEELGYPYMISCYSLGLAAGQVHDDYATFGVYNTADLPIPKEKLKNALHYLDRVRLHAKQVNANKALLKRIDDMIATTKKASKREQFQELGLSMAKWYGEMFDFLMSTSYVPPPKE